jgi:hypothetical protein
MVIIWKKTGNNTVPMGVMKTFVWMTSIVISRESRASWFRQRNGSSLGGRMPQTPPTFGRVAVLAGSQKANVERLVSGRDSPTKDKPCPAGYLFVRESTMPHTTDGSPDIR